MAMTTLSGEASPQTVHENVYLVEATDPDAAYELANAIGVRDAEAQGPLHDDERQFRAEFAGVRKLISISNFESASQDETPPVSGTELTYSFFEVKTEEQ